MSNKKYYWLKLKEDFFEEDTLQWLEEQDNGKEYCLFYLKLCLKSLKTNGVLIRNVGQMLIPYDSKKLSEITKTDVDTVLVALELFKKIGLVQILENGEIFLTQLENMVGSETNKAALMRKKRAKDKLGNNVTTTLPKCYTEIEKEIDIDIEKELQQDKELIELLNSDSSCSSFNEIFKFIENHGFINLSPLMIEKFKEDINMYGKELVKKAIEIADEQNKHTYAYFKGILNNIHANGVDGKCKNGFGNSNSRIEGKESGISGTTAPGWEGVDWSKF